jgi:hypothetical protein
MRGSYYREPLTGQIHCKIKSIALATAKKEGKNKEKIIAPIAIALLDKSAPLRSSTSRNRLADRLLLGANSRTLRLLPQQWILKESDRTESQSGGFLSV